MTSPPIVRQGAELKTPQKTLRRADRETLLPHELAALKTRLEKKIEENERIVEKGIDEDDRQKAMVRLEKLKTQQSLATATSSYSTEEERVEAMERLGWSLEEQQEMFDRVKERLEEEKVQPVYLPSTLVRLVRPPEGTSPFEAHFRIPNSMKKPDLWDYLVKIYHVGIRDIRTMNYIEKMRRLPPGSPTVTSPRKKPSEGGRTFKKAIVNLIEPFWFPPELTQEELQRKFNVDDSRQNIQKFLLKLGGWRMRGPVRTNRVKENQAEERLGRLEERDRILKEAEGGSS